MPKPYHEILHQVMGIKAMALLTLSKRWRLLRAGVRAHVQQPGPYLNDSEDEDAHQLQSSNKLQHQQQRPASAAHHSRPQGPREAPLPPDAHMRGHQSTTQHKASAGTDVRSSVAHLAASPPVSTACKPAAEQSHAGSARDRVWRRPAWLGVSYGGAAQQQHPLQRHRKAVMTMNCSHGCAHGTELVIDEPRLYTLLHFVPARSHSVKCNFFCV